MIGLLINVQMAVAVERGIGLSAITRLENEPRTALVIGNSRYAKFPLPNAANDGKAMADKLRKLGFEVIYRENASRNEMLQAIREYGDRLESKKGVGLVFFAGHGIQSHGENYLLPVDVELKFEEDLPLQSVPANAIIDKMGEAENRLNILIMDACRDAPLAKRSRSAQSGLAKMDAPSGTLIAFSTAPGQTAADGNGTHSPYTEQLLATMSKPGLKIEDVFKLVRGQVRKMTQGSQTPWENTSLEGDFYFVEGSQGQVNVIVQAPSEPKSSTNSVVTDKAQTLRAAELFPLFDGVVSAADLEQGIRLESRSRSVFQQASMLAIQSKGQIPIANVVALQSRFNQQLQSKELLVAEQTLKTVAELTDPTRGVKASELREVFQQETESYCTKVKQKMTGMRAPWTEIYTKNCLGIRIALLQGDELQARDLYAAARQLWSPE
ncbi:caspase family protein [Chitinibacter sp. FCG-7]|uniref:Caspase family protein n=1 Tax=Chitinibacter mangrovi TaxID=3153927 RepID=A0AAU7FBA8_9NEIS